MSFYIEIKRLCFRLYFFPPFSLHLPVFILMTDFLRYDGGPQHFSDFFKLRLKFFWKKYSIPCNISLQVGKSGLYFFKTVPEHNILVDFIFIFSAQNFIF